MHCARARGAGMAMHTHGASMFVRQTAHHPALTGSAGIAAGQKRERRGKKREDEGDRLNTARHLFVHIKCQLHTDANTIRESCYSKYASMR